MELYAGVSSLLSEDDSRVRHTPRRRFVVYAESEEPQWEIESDLHGFINVQNPSRPRLRDFY